jgi:putative tricarboxylic transport membrane protein
MLNNLLHGLTSLLSPSSIGYLLAGAVLGMVVGVIPGLSTAVVLSILLVFVYHINLTGTLCLFLGAKAASYYSASVSAILLNTPAHPEAFPITLDGYPMARKGQPGRALGLSAASTCIGAVLGCAVFLAFVPIMDDLTKVFHPPEYLALVTLAMLLVGTLGSDSLGKAVAAGGAGLMVASVGPSTITGVFRYTFGTVELYSGLALVAVALGIFAIPQMVMVYGTGTATARQDMTGKEISDGDVEVELTHGHARELFGGVLETFKHRFVLFQGGVIGALSGILPGIGGFAGNYLSYGLAKQLSKTKDSYGTGNPEGIIAPEGSSLAKEAGHMVPILSLGIPGGVGGALFLAALTIKGVKTGSGFTQTYPLIPYQIAWILALSGLIGTLIGIGVGPQIARVTRVPGPLLVPFIFVMCVSGVYFAEGTFFSVIEIIIFGLIGLALRRLKYPIGSFVLGLVLGPTFETNIYLTHSIYHGASFLTARPFADVIWVLCIIVLVAKWIEVRRARRDRPEAALTAPYPVLALVTTVCLLALGLLFVIYGAAEYDFTTAAMPVVGGIFVTLPMLAFLPRDVRRLLAHRRRRRELGADLPSAALEPLAPLTADGSGGVATVVEAVAEIESRVTVSSGRYAAIERSWGKDGQFRRELIALGWLGGLMLASWLVGFAWGSTVFVAAYALLCTRRFFATRAKWWIFTVVSTVLIYGVIYEMFDLTHIIFTPQIGV